MVLCEGERGGGEEGAVGLVWDGRRGVHRAGWCKDERKTRLIRPSKREEEEYMPRTV